jgi:hypothetical protein
VFLLCSWFPSLQIASTGVVWHGETFYDSAVTPEKKRYKNSPDFCMDSVDLVCY